MVDNSKKFCNLAQKKMQGTYLPWIKLHSK